MSIEDVSAGLRERAERTGGIDRTVKFDFGKDGAILVGGAVPTAVRIGDGAADCTITMSMDNFLKLSAGKLNPQLAFVMGKMRIKGDMGVARRIRSILG